MVFTPRKIIVHCSDSHFGNAAIIDEWHKARGWNGIGYHYVILNGVMRSGEKYQLAVDGFVERGRPENEVGAHCDGQNHDSLSVCMIGVEHFTAAQLYVALPTLLLDLMRRHGIQPEHVYGHYEFDKNGKTCPNFKIDPVRRLLKMELFERRSAA